MTNVDAWLAALEKRHLANLTRPELTRALRALSSCYVERREKLTSGAALEGAGKRAAFALFYGPLHFLTLTAVVRALLAHEIPLETIADLGCGTGVGGAAWALACARPPSIAGVDRSAWAVQEANWTYAALGLRGRAKTGDVIRNYPAHGPKTAVLLAYTVNELPGDTRASLLDRVSQTVRAGSRVLIVEPIARGVAAWWPEWTARLAADGARADEWRFPAMLPPLTRQIAKGAGLDPRELTARTISKL
jgi:methyltransferase family protein